MSPDWEALCRWGVPHGAIRAAPSGSLDPGDLNQVIADLNEARFEELDPTMRECLFAWLRAFRHHWPDRFEQVLGETGTAALAALWDQAADSNRYLKLRRIAVENLSSLI
jgi:hypothetical protein